MLSSYSFTLGGIFVAIVITYILIFVINRIRHFRLFHRLGIPGPEPSFISGNLRHLRFSNRNVLHVYDDWYHSYGPVYGYYAGTQPTLVVHDLDIVKDVLIKNSQRFINRPKLVVNTRPVSHTLVGLRGQRWKDVRSVLTPTFSVSKMRQMNPLMCSSLEETLGILEESDQCGFDVVALYQGLTCDVISKCALAMKVNCQRDPNDKFLLAVKGFLAHALNPLVMVAVCFPIIGRILGMIINRFAVSGQMTSMICENVRKVLKFRRDEFATLDRTGPPKYLDVLQLMIDAAATNPQRQLSDDEIIANSWVFVLGGFETTASAMAFTTYLLSLHPDVQDHLFDELQEAFAIDEVPTYEQVSGLVYLDQIVCETLRLYPPVVTFIVRHVEVESVIGPHLVPPDVTIHVPIWQIHHDPKLWPDPYKFDPERFSPTNKKRHHSLSWIPFGAGPRNCIGSRFGLLETKLTIARIFRTFKFMPTERTETNLELCVPTVVISAKNGIYLRCERRLR